MTKLLLSAALAALATDARLRRAVDIVQRVEALPAVQAAFASNFVPLSGAGWWRRVVALACCRCVATVDRSRRGRRC